jgi:hypothetical protein
LFDESAQAAIVQRASCVRGEVFDDRGGMGVHQFGVVLALSNWARQVA